MDFVHRKFCARQRIADCNGCVGKAAGVDDDGGTLSASRVNGINQNAFVIALNALCRQAEAFGVGDAGRLQVLERFAAVDVRLTQTKQVEVGAVYDKNLASQSNSPCSLFLTISNGGLRKAALRGDSSRLLRQSGFGKGLYDKGNCEEFSLLREIFIPARRQTVMLREKQPECTMMNVEAKYQMVRDAVTQVADEAGIEAAALLAVVEVESGGRTHAMVGGRAEPLIRFEGHYFHKLLPTAKRHQAIVAGLAHPVAEKVRNPLRQVDRWAMLQRACVIDRPAALSSVSWGVGQVMGAHWRWLGYADVEHLAAEARSGVEGQVRLLARFVEKSGLSVKLIQHDWAGFARSYNGPAYKQHGYDRKMQQAYQRIVGASAPNARHQTAFLRLGSTGNSVEELQFNLRQLGYPLIADGDFGPATQAALSSFQQSAGLKPDGIFGAASLEAMMRSLPCVKENRGGIFSRALTLFTGIAVV